MISTAVNTSLFVEGSHKMSEFRASVIKSVKFVSLLLVPALVVIFLVGGKLLLLFGEDYSQHGTILLWLMSTTAIPYAVIELFVVANRVRLKTMPVIVACSASAVVTLGASYVLGANFGLNGIGIGWLAGQSVVALVCGWMLLRWLNKSKGQILLEEKG